MISYGFNSERKSEGILIDDSDDDHDGDDDDDDYHNYHKYDDNDNMTMMVFLMMFRLSSVDKVHIIYPVEVKRDRMKDRHPR